MDNIIIGKTKNTLGINFDSNKGTMELLGSSFPENAKEFFDPLIDWVQKYMLEVTGDLTVKFHFDYLNSSSIKYVSDIIDKLDNYSKSGGNVVGNWYYDENDEDIQEMGEDLKEEVSFNLNIIEN